MPTAEASILCVGGDIGRFERVKSLLKEGGTPFRLWGEDVSFALSYVATISLADLALKRKGFDLIIFIAHSSNTDRHQEIDSLRALKKISRMIPIVVIGSKESPIPPVGYIREGAEDFLFYGSLASESLARSVCYSIERAEQYKRLWHEKRKTEAELTLKRDYFASISHELRTPLCAIIGYANRLLESSGSRGESVKAATTIARNSNHLLDMVNDIMEICKLEAVGLKITPERCRVKDLIGDIVALLRIKAHEKGISLSCTFERGFPEICTLDPVRFKQILINLIGNAIKFTEKGSITVRGRYLERGNKLCIEVIDTGIGIERDKLSKIFSPYYQCGVDSSAFKGSGLGLYIVSKLVSQMGGEISVASTYGEGSRFTFSVSAGANSRLDPSIGIGVESNSGKRRFHGAETKVLLVEDCEDNRDLISYYLRKFGYDVLEAGTGREAINIADKEDISLILMDMSLPDIDGYRATQKIKEKGIDVPIVALTADTEAKERCYEAGCDGYLAKPFEEDELSNLLLSFLSIGDKHAFKHEGLELRDH